MKTFFILLSLTFLSFSLQAQDFIILSGKIIDKKTEKPIAYANIGLPKQGIGTTSGDDGAFILKIPSEYSQGTVQISYIGYQTIRKAVLEFKTQSTFFLSQSATELTEIVVTEKSNVKDIIRAAIDNVGVNYPTKPTNVLAFYRESLTDEKGEYEYLAEGIMRVYKNSYKSRKEGDVQLVQSRKLNLKNPLDTTLNAAFSSGHMAAQRFDVVRNREDFINKRFLKAYEYKIESVTTFNDKPVWVISFDKDESYTPKRTKNSIIQMIMGRTVEAIYARMRGKIYIEQGSYAIIRTEFEITPLGLEKIWDYPLYSGEWKGNFYVTNYRKIGNKWHFSDALREGTYGNGQLYANEVLVTENDGKRGAVIPYLDRMSSGGYFVNNTKAYDEDFWKNYNTAPMNARLRESATQMNNILKANEVFATDKMREIQELRDSTALAERLAELETQQKDRGELSDEELERLVIGEPGLKEEEETKLSFRANFGAGIHVIPSGGNRIGVQYLDGELSQEIVSATGDISKRNFEIIGYGDYDFTFNNGLFIRFGSGGNFIKSIHKERNVGLGWDFNLSKGRPINLRLAAQHSRLFYARKIGQAVNNFGNFRADGEKFTAEKINLYYGSRTHNVKLSAEWGIELGRHRGFFLRGSYYLPFAQRNNVYLWERGQVFRKKVRVSESDPRVNLIEGASLVDLKPSFSISLGFNFY